MQIFGYLSATTQICHHLHYRRIAILWLVNDVIECQKHTQVKFLRTKYNKVRILKYVTYSRIIYHAYYSNHHNQPACSNNVKKYYMLDFNEFFGIWMNVEKRWKTRIPQNFLWRRCVADGAHADALCCGCGLFAHLYSNNPVGKQIPLEVFKGPI